MFFKVARANVPSADGGLRDIFYPCLIKTFRTILNSDFKTVLNVQKIWLRFKIYAFLLLQ